MHGFTSDKFIRGLTQTRVPAAPTATQTNLAAGSRSGTTVTADASTHTKGLYTEIIASLSNDTYGLWITASGVFSPNSLRNFLVDVALGAAASEVDIIPNIDFSAAGTKVYYFPGLFLAAGTRISCRAQSNVTVQAGSISIFLDQGLRHDVVQTTVITYGADTANSRGTSVTPGSGAFGSWTEIGTTSRDHNIFLTGLDALATASIADQEWLMEIGYGSNSGAVTTIGSFKFKSLGTSIYNFGPVVAYAPTISGTKLFARIATANTTAVGIIIHGT